MSEAHPLPWKKQAEVAHTDWPDVNRAAVHAHIMMLHELAKASGVDGVMVLASFEENPDTGSKAKPIIERFSVGDVDGMVEAAVGHATVRNRNTYAPLSVLRKGMAPGQRGGRDDVLAVLGFVADLDADTGKVGDLPLAAPYVIESSPGNRQAVYPLSRALPVSEAEDIAVALADAIGCDHGTKSVEHLWRIPGLLNWPTKKKIERGRSQDPQPVRIAESWGGDLVDPDAISSAVSGFRKSDTADAGREPAGDGWIGDDEDADALLAGCDDELRKMIVTPAAPSEDRSRTSGSVICRLLGDGLTDEAIKRLIEAHPDGIGERYVQRGKDLAADIARNRRKFGPEPVPQSVIDSASAMLANWIKKRTAKVASMLKRSSDFIADFRPPDYLIEGIAQKAYLYSLTALTGHGKTAILLTLGAYVAERRAFAGREIEGGRVLFLAGENPDDIRARWIALAHHIGFDVKTVDVIFRPGVFDIAKGFEDLKAAAAEFGDLALVIVDTAAAFFPGDDDNANVAMGNFARDLRKLNGLPGKPCVIVAAHPTKNASAGNLLPRGGGAFLNEVDGNLTASKDGSVVTVHWQGKHRGPDFEPLRIALETVTTPGLVDTKGRPMPSVIARALTDQEAASIGADETRAEDVLLEIMLDNERASISRLAELAGWMSAKGEPQKSKVQRILATFSEKERPPLAKKTRGAWHLTDHGTAEAKRIRDERKEREAMAQNLYRKHADCDD